MATLTARAPATIGLELASDVAPRPEVAVADDVAVGVCASMIRFGMPLSVGEPPTNAFVVMSTMFTEIATPVAAPPPLTGLASAVALELCFEPAWIFRSCADVIVPVPARDDWVVPVRRLKAIAAPTDAVPSLVLARPPVIVFGALPELFADAPPGLDFAVELTVWSESALTLSVLAVTDPETDAVVVASRFPTEMPAPLVSPVASPLTVELVVFVADTPTDPDDVIARRASDCRDRAAVDDQRRDLSVGARRCVGAAGRGCAGVHDRGRRTR